MVLTIKQIETQYGDILTERDLEAMTVYKRLKRQEAKGETPDIEEALRSKRESYSAFGRTQSLADWARDYQIGESTLRSRLKRGMTIEAALQVPPGAVRSENGRLWTLDGETKTMRRWATDNGVRYAALRAAVTRYVRKHGEAEDVAMRKALADLRTLPRTLLLEGERKPLEEWAQIAELPPDELAARMDRGQQLRDIIDETTELVAFGITVTLRQWAEALLMKPQDFLGVYRANHAADPEMILRTAAQQRTGEAEMFSFLERAVESMGGVYAPG